MPNWCNNTLTITCASKEEADELHKHLENQEAEDWTFFGFFVPEDWNEEDWYWSRVNAWGTKWDASISHYEWVDDYSLVMDFDTAWGPPIGVYEAAHEQGYTIMAAYFEPGMCFVGSWDVGDTEHYEYSDCESADDIRERVGDELDDMFGISDWFREIEEEETLH